MLGFFRKPRLLEYKMAAIHVTKEDKLVLNDENKNFMFRFN